MAHTFAARTPITEPDPARHRGQQRRIGADHPRVGGHYDRQEGVNSAVPTIILGRNTSTLTFEVPKESTAPVDPYNLDAIMMATLAEKHTYALFGERTLHIAYFRDVKNAAALRQATLDKQVDAALINAQLVVDRFQVHAAAARALLCDQSDRLTTKSLHAELVFNLSGSRNVSESFRRFGINNDCTSLVVCLFDADDATLEKALAFVEGTATSVDELGQHLAPADVKLVKKYYKIQELELTNSSLADAITCRIATKSCSK